MKNLILVRHGQSEWNLENRFTGWVDVDLTPKGKLEACKAGELIKEEKLEIKFFFTSLQKRAINTLGLILNTLRKKNIEIIKSWQLNERHYGALTGLNKDEMRKKYGEKKIQEFRRSWNIRPDLLSKNNPYHPVNIDIYKNIPKDNIPDTESLEDTYNRVIPYYKKNIENQLNNNNILIVAHGNSIRSLCKFLFKLDEKKISFLEIPTGNPLIINFNKELEIIDIKYLDKSRAKDLIAF